MSSVVVSTSAAHGRPFVFDADANPEVHSEVLRSRVLRSTINHQQSKILPASVTPASQLEIRPAPEMVSSGIPAIDALTGGLPRGCLTEICGPASSGRTTVLLAALAAATRRGEFCAVVDASDALDPHSAAAAGVDLDRLLWVRCGDDSPRRHKDTEKQKNQKQGCPTSRAPSAREVGFSSAAFNSDDTRSRAIDHRLEQVLRATDLLLESGGFGLIVLDLGDLPPQSARRIPLTTWFRFRRAVEYTPTILLAIEQRSIAGSCSSLLLQLGSPNNQEETMMLDRSESSREAAAWESPARECRVAMERASESRRDGTTSRIACPPHAQLLTGLDITVELIRSRMDCKPARSVAFATKTAWAG